jgi:DNA polymerase V
LWQTVDGLNQKLGWGKMRVLGAGLKPTWALRSAHRSPRWTTRWQELPNVKA